MFHGHFFDYLDRVSRSSLVQHTATSISLGYNALYSGNGQAEELCSLLVTVANLKLLNYSVFISLDNFFVIQTHFWCYF